jgi:hypothetical protein
LTRPTDAAPDLGEPVSGCSAGQLALSERSDDAKATRTVERRTISLTAYGEIPHARQCGAGCRAGLAIGGHAMLGLGSTEYRRDGAKLGGRSDMPMRDEMGREDAALAIHRSLRDRSERLPRGRVFGMRAPADHGTLVLSDARVDAAHGVWNFKADCEFK